MFTILLQVYHLVDCLVLLEETDTRYTNYSEYRTADSVLSEIYEEEDRTVREREESKFRLHKQDIVSTFQVFPSLAYSLLCSILLGCTVEI